MGKVGKFLAGVALIVGGVLVQGIPGVGQILGGILIASGIGMIRGTLFGPSIGDLDLKFRSNRLSMLDAIPMIYGERLIGGVVADYRVSGGGGVFGGSNKYLYITLVLTHTPDNGLGIEGVGEVFLNGKFAFDATGATDNPASLVSVNSGEFDQDVDDAVFRLPGV